MNTAESAKERQTNQENALGVDDVVERHQRVVGVPNKGALPSQTRLHLCLEPFVQHVVQEDVREAGRDHTPLRGALGRVAQETVFDGSRLQPFSDQKRFFVCCYSSRMRLRLTAARPNASRAAIKRLRVQGAACRRLDDRCYIRHYQLHSVLVRVIFG